MTEAAVDVDTSSEFAVWIWPVLSAIIGSFVLLTMVYYIQRPKLVAKIVKDEYFPQFGQHYVHLRVNNARKPFLGGGTAINCRGRITLEDGRSFLTKWATRPNPIRTDAVGTGGNEIKAIPILEPALIDGAKNEYIRPGEERALDVAVRFNGDPSCYIHEPENFADPNYKPERTKVGVGEFPFTCVLEYEGGKSRPFRFKIVNKDGDSPGLLSLGEHNPNPRLPRSILVRFGIGLGIAVLVVGGFVLGGLLGIWYLSSFPNPYIIWFLVVSSVPSYIISDVVEWILKKRVKRWRPLRFAAFVVSMLFSAEIGALLEIGTAVTLSSIPSFVVVAFTLSGLALVLPIPYFIIRDRARGGVTSTLPKNIMPNTEESAA